MKHPASFLSLLFAVVLLFASCGHKPKEAATEAPADSLAAAALPDMSKYMPQVEVGTAAYAFELPDSAGILHSLADYAGQWVVVDFWASWCGDCRAEIPAVKDLYARWQPQGVAFVGISFDQKPEQWTTCLKQNDFPWLQLCNFVPWRDKQADGTEIVHPAAEGYGLHWIPTLFLISPEGKVAAYALTAAELAPLLTANVSKK